MCRFLSLDFEIDLKCPVDKANHRVRFQAYPSPRVHPLEVRDCDAKPLGEQLSCGKACRGLVESGEYWQTIYPQSATLIPSQ